ncbi:MAG TPA: peptide chain release factor 3 [Planctomycetota bacterium]|nr:peptide chain release factor 3 [Planctomycetota bacterium]
MPDPVIAREVARRRTFAIISHPDAGKTTLTEKFLLYGGAIAEAGAVKARRTGNYARSDWMEIERERGISVASTVLVFDYRGMRVNLLDTPGHQDFSEDTYRVLSAVDSAVMLLDGGRGVQEQTEKLFLVCKKRGIPLFTFINKMDRPAREPLDLLDQIEKTLGVAATPATWPIGNGASFEGVYDRVTKKVHLFERVRKGAEEATLSVYDADDPALADLIDSTLMAKLAEDRELLDGALPELDAEMIRAGYLTPVYFGSAMTNFGVELFLNAVLDQAPPPSPRAVAQGTVDPTSDRFSGFVFKIQANMNRAHRDRVAFLRVCSGRFERGMNVKHPRLGREVRLTHPHALFATERTTIDDAYAGDVVGLVNSGLFQIGDTVHTGEAVRFEDIPRFSPEHFVETRPASPSKQKGFRKGLESLAAEGVVQLFFPRTGRREPVLGAVGPLQFDVVKARMEEEYDTPLVMEKMPYSLARWVERKDLATLELRDMPILEDAEGRLVTLFRSDWELRYFVETYPAVKLAFTSGAAVDAAP